ncbi:hypothetical protein QWY99_07285 [Flavobacterium branchiarum]|uniref:Protein SirB1 N-terminal domain-containing protein n=1 Tax=Flavobacterium branchiarum TaxID=1114870 RepID=A0ABV5FRJ0_9FLAO|nr:hypothetical protein [Flavobacterium branchiarum]MDN3672852.1 hypothetical protein [Flavobacterium branchiarum]
MKLTEIILSISLFLSTILTSGQVRFPSPNDHYTPFNTNPHPNFPNAPRIDIFDKNDFLGLKQQQQITEQQNRQLIRENELIERRKKERLKLISSWSNQSKNSNYVPPTFSNLKGTEYYRNVYDKMLTLNKENFSVKDVNFEIENAYFENKLDKDLFDKTIKQTGKFLIAKMKELNYDVNSNALKNFMLFEFFTQPLEVNGFKEKHFPIKYDFEDYSGNKDLSKMFVTKLMRTGTGQCHSMPLYYLILAEEIGAKAYLALSPNHMYIKFQDETGKWYNLELTRGVYTVSSFILNSGFIKAEAIQNRIYMKGLSKQQLLSQFYTDLAVGYVQKYGYDGFIEKVINKAIELYPNNINANMLKANYDNAFFRYVTNKIGINPEDNKELQKINAYPQAVHLLNKSNKQYKRIKDLGYQHMPAEAYENWLGSLKDAKHKQENETVKKQFKGLIIKKQKD